VTMYEMLLLERNEICDGMITVQQAMQPGPENQMIIKVTQKQNIPRARNPITALQMKNMEPVKKQPTQKLTQQVAAVQ
jgi:hypothetical protein